MKLKKLFMAPASETQLGILVGVETLLLSLATGAILWQSNVIAYQMEIIRWLWTGRFGG